MNIKEGYQYMGKQKEIKADEKILDKLDKHINKIYEANKKVANNFERVFRSFRTY